MNARAFASTLSLIPERVARVPMGMAFDPDAMGGPFPERMALLGRFLNWLGPLTPIGRDEQRVLGLMTAYGKPAVGGMEGEGDAHPEDALLDAPEADEEASAPIAATADSSHVETSPV